MPRKASMWKRLVRLTSRLESGGIVFAGHSTTALTLVRAQLTETNPVLRSYIDADDKSHSTNIMHEHITLKQYSINDKRHSTTATNLYLLACDCSRSTHSAGPIRVWPYSYPTLVSAWSSAPHTSLAYLNLLIHTANTSLFLLFVRLLLIIISSPLLKCFLYSFT